VKKFTEQLTLGKTCIFFPTHSKRVHFIHKALWPLLKGKLTVAKRLGERRVVICNLSEETKLGVSRPPHP
jgi:hypothetical protein